MCQQSECSKWQAALPRLLPCRWTGRFPAAAMPARMHDLTATSYLKSRMAGSTILSFTFISLSQTPV